jgi:hypothetical protein
VDGLPLIDHVDQVCDNCLVNKQRRLSFPWESKYWAEHKLELVHGDLCGPVTPATPSGNRFLFLLDDILSHYMCVTLMSMKDQARKGFMAFQAQDEAEAGQRPGTLRTERGGKS